MNYFRNNNAFEGTLHQFKHNKSFDKLKSPEINVKF